MALIRRGNGGNQQLAAMAGAVSATEVLELARELSRRLPGFKNGGTPSRLQRKLGPPRKKSRQSGSKQASNGGTKPNASAAMMYKSVSNGGPRGGSITISDFGMYGLGTSGTTGSGGTYVRVAMNNTSGDSDSTLASLCPKFAAMRDLYAHYNLKSLKVSWVPSLADTASGNVAICFDQREKNGGDNILTNYLRKNHHTFQHITSPGGFVWKPTDAMDKLQRLVDVDTNDRADMGYGYINFAYTSNQLTAGISLGYVRIDATVEFHDPK